MRPRTTATAGAMPLLLLMLLLAVLPATVNSATTSAGVSDTTEMPTAASDTTEPPTVESDTTEAPTVESDTTEPPTVESDTTEPPTVESDTTEAPTVDSDTTEAPTVESDTTEPPTVESDTTEAPTVQSDTTEAPTVQSDTTEAPTVQSDTTEAPTVQSDTTEAPTVQSDTTQAAGTAAVNLCDQYGYLCENGGYCVMIDSSYKCVCAAGYTGLLCNVPLGTEYCSTNNPCYNGATCSEGSDGFPNCTCVTGFTGYLCHININDCSPMPCVNSLACIDRVNDFVCVCNPGWEGKTCANDIDECLSSPCHADAICTNTPGNYSCACKPGYYGNGTECTELTVLSVQNGSTIPRTSFNYYTISTFKIESDIPFIIGEKESSTCTISKNGYLSFSDPPYQQPWPTYYTYLTKPMVFPYWSYRLNFTYADSAVYYELLEKERHTNTLNYQKVSEIVNSYSGAGSNFQPLNALIVTWNKMGPYSWYYWLCYYCNYYYRQLGYSWAEYYCKYCNQEEEHLTFQAIVTRNESHSFLIINLGEFKFNRWRWYYWYTASGFTDGYQKFQMLGHSYYWWRTNYITDNLLMGNVGKRGRHVLTMATSIPASDKLKCRNWMAYEKTRQITGNLNCDNCPRDMRQAVLDWRYWPYEYKCDKQGSEKNGFYWLTMCFRGRFECRQDFADFTCRWSWSWWCRWERCQFYVAPRCCYKMKIDWKKDNVLYDYCSSSYSTWYLRWMLRNEMFNREKSGSLDHAGKNAGHSQVLERSRNYWWFSKYDEQLRNETYGMETCLAAPAIGQYQQLRPKCTSTDYSEPIWGFNRGDPHISTLDGTTYSFNGLCEYYMLRNKSSDFLFLELQSRTSLAPSSNPNVTSQATVFTAFALKAGTNNVSISVELNSAGNDLSVFKDAELLGTVVGHFSQQENATEIEGYSLKSDDNSSITVSEADTGFSVTVTRVLNFLQAAVQLDQSKHRAGVEGLMGNFNGNDTDDFRMRNGTLLPAGSSERQLFDFGQSWRLLDTDNRYFAEPNSGGAIAANPYCNLTFVPIFVDEYKDRLLELFSNNSELMVQANQTCWSTNQAVYLSCMYDAAQLQTISAAQEAVLTVKKETSAKAVAANRAPVCGMPANVTVTANTVFNITVNCPDPDGNPVTLTVEEPSNDTSVWLDGGVLIWNVPGDMNSTNLTVQATDSLGAPAQWTPVVLFCHCQNGGVCNFDWTTGSSAAGASFYRAQCDCPNGYQGDSCEVTPCDAQPNPCYNATMCHMYSNGTFYCDSCPDGMTGDGQMCEDIDECLETPGICQEQCTNLAPGYECSCTTPGYQVSPTNTSICVDIDECATGVHRCRLEQNQTCVNTNGSYLCQCQTSGYEVNALYECQDVNECEKTPGICGDGECVNVDGNYTCECTYGSLKINGACQNVIISNSNSGSGSTTTTDSTTVIIVAVVGSVVAVGVIVVLIVVYLRSAAAAPPPGALVTPGRN